MPSEQGTLDGGDRHLISLQGKTESLESTKFSSGNKIGRENDNDDYLGNY